MSLEIIFSIFSLGISFIALGVSIYHARIAKKQKDMQKTEHQIKLEEYRKAEIESKKAKFNVTLYPIDHGNCTIQFTNVGYSEARNIDFDFQENYFISKIGEEDEKFPHEKLEPGNKVTYTFGAFKETPNKLHLNIYWEDNYEVNNKKSDFVEIP